MAITANALVQVSLIGTCFGQRIILTHVYKNQLASPVLNDYTTDLNEILDQVGVGGVDDLVTPYLALMPQQYTLQRIRAQAIKPVRSVAIERNIVAGSGTHPDAATVANDAAVLTFRTQLAGRNQVSNKHIGPVPDGVSDQGLIIPAYRTLMGTLGTRMLSPVVPVGWASSLLAVVPHIASGTGTEMYSFIAQDTSRVMRRRTVRVGE